MNYRRAAKRKAGDVGALPAVSCFVNLASAFSDSEHLGAAHWADSLSCRFTVFHGDRFGILHFPLGSALNTVGLHPSPPFWI